MKNLPITLGIETALKNGSLSVFRGENQIASYAGDKNVARAEDLLQGISALLKDNDIKPGEIGLISVSVGPGSFTGIRIGVSTAQALAAGFGCRRIGVSLLEALSLKVGRNQDAVTVIPAGRDQLIWQSFFQEIKEAQKIVPQMGTIEDFILYIKSLGKSSFSIISAPEIFEVLSSAQFSPDTDIKFHNASDNVAELVTRLGLTKFHSKFSLTNQILKAEYLFDVKIGRN